MTILTTGWLLMVIAVLALNVSGSARRPSHAPPQPADRLGRLVLGLLAEFVVELARQRVVELGQRVELVTTDLLPPRSRPKEAS